MSREDAPPVVVRELREPDVPTALVLMRDLARFEGYLDAFRVTEEDILQHGFGPDRRFLCFVAEADGLLGLAVVHEDPWNYQMASTLVLKELYVRPEARGRGVGAALFGAVQAHCRSIGAARLRWLVLRDNVAAARFYESVGGEASKEWKLWSLPCLRA